MTDRRDRAEATLGLRTGLIILLAVALAFVALMAGGWFDNRLATGQAEAPALVPLEAVLSDDATRQYLRQLDLYAPETATALRAQAQIAMRSGEDQNMLADLVLRALLSQFQRDALRFRYAQPEDFDAILAHLRTGFQTLSGAASPWCDANAVETLLKRADTDLIDTLLAEFEYDGAAYRWVLQWGGIYLKAADRAGRYPVRYGPRSAYDKTVLQDHGRALASREWALALQIASFSQAEGQGYAPMRQAIDSIDVCKLAITVVDLSDDLPTQTRARIWAELMPEIFYGNTPYVLALVTNYFFID